MPPKAQKSKEAKLLAAQSAAKSKGKKKWSKGKLREKKIHKVVFTAQLFDKFMKEVPKKMKVITVYNLIEQYKINGSLARRGIQELLKKNLIRPVDTLSCNPIYTGMHTDKGAKEEAEASKKDEKKGGKKQAAKPKKEEAAPAEETAAETAAPAETSDE